MCGAKGGHLQDDPAARSVVDAAYAAWEFLPSDMHAKGHSASASSGGSVGGIPSDDDA